MIDDVLKYISVITVAGAAISFVIGLVKYLDQRNREERTKRYEIFHGLMRRVSAFGDKSDEGIPLTQQLAAIYELKHFNEYVYASVPILEHLYSVYTERQSPPVLLKAIEETLGALGPRCSR
jgi:hypothetical protein